MRALFYYTGNFAQIPASISGTAELLRTLGAGDVHAKYLLELHKKPGVLGSLGHLRKR